MTSSMKIRLQWSERIRLSVLSVLPAGIINALGVLFNVRVRLDLICLVVTVVYLYCFLKDGQKRKNGSDETIIRR